METKIIIRRNHSDAAAFVEISKDGRISVRGKFYDGFRGCPGPMTYINLRVPDELRKEVDDISGWADSRSPELEKFCQQCFEEAATKEPWFKIFLT